ncbi:MAG: hypothetical protein IPK60_02940 [Sandaracinaceae bacterium]|nr:hypothetical protein [Sandaracinaceae bacterium]
MRIRFVSNISLASLIALAGLSVTACATQAAAPAGEAENETGTGAGGKADSASAEWSPGTGTSWRRAMNAAHYVNVPSGALEEGGICSGFDSQQVTLSSVLSEHYFSSLDSDDESVTDQTRTISLEYKRGPDSAITYRLHIDTETTVRGLDATDESIEETFGSNILIEFAADATAQTPVVATVTCAG